MVTLCITLLYKYNKLIMIVFVTILITMRLLTPTNKMLIFHSWIVNTNNIYLFGRYIIYLKHI